VRILLDTHVLLWWLFADERLTTDMEAVIADRTNDILVSGASGFEIAVKQAIGKLDAPDDLPEQLATSGFSELPVTVLHGLEV
jgi:PIN domain nuclease of toxin-antitoxin system